MQQLTAQLYDHINCSYSSFDRVLLGGYPLGVFVEGSVKRLLRNLGFTGHSNGDMQTLTDQLNDHRSTIALPLDSKIRWWSEAEKRMLDKHQQTVVTGSGQRIPAPDSRKQHQLELMAIGLSSNSHALGLRNKDLRAKWGGF